MIKIPNEQKIFSQPNNSDLFGNIWYTKNINFDEEGYAKLSSRVFQFKSEEDDNNFNIPISFGRATGEFHIVTSDQAFDLTLLDSSFSITEDVNTDNPTLTLDSWGKWFNNKWHASTATKIWHTTGGTWTDSTASLTTGKVHVLEVFRNKNSLAVSNGNTVLLLNTSYATTVTLTLPADHEVISMAYSNNKMGIITMLSDSVAGQNQDAYFFTWDGSSAEAGQGIPIGSDTGMGIVAYKSSWVILTRNGELKYWNGGGFGNMPNGDEPRFPFYFKNITWGDSQNRETAGDTIVVEGDVIYINVGNDFSVFGRKGEDFLAPNPAGVWCYDPKVGLYHRHAPSLSPGYFVTVLSAGVNTTTDIITANSGTLPPTGNPIKYIDSASSKIGGLMVGNVYYIIKHNTTTFSLATTKQNALDGVKVNLTAANDAKFLTIEVRDYGTSIADTSGGIGIVEYRQQVADHLLFGVDIPDYNSTTFYDMLCLTCPRFSNRGYIVYTKINSDNIEDNIPVVYIKHRALGPEDRIILKYKPNEVYGIPTGTPQFGTGSICTWSDVNTFTTTADLSDIKTYLDADTLNECEVEIISGAGAGQMAQISSISEAGGTYTINLAEDIEGAASGNKCNVLIDNWKLLKTDADVAYISSSNTRGWEEFPIATSQKSALFKVELRGDETTIEELQITNKKQK